MRAMVGPTRMLQHRHSLPKICAHPFLLLLLLLLLLSPVPFYAAAAAAEEEGSIGGGIWDWLFNGLCFSESDTRCGLFGWGRPMNRPNNDDESCQQICSYFTLWDALFFGYQCGVCEIITANAAPTLEPSTAPSLAPSSAPSRPTATAYDIHLDLSEGAAAPPTVIAVPAEDRPLVTQAAVRWQEVVIGDLPDRNSQLILDAFPDTGAPPAGCTYPETIDDLYLCVQYRSDVDGPNGVLAFASPTFWRLPSFLPLAGRLVVDAADAAALRDLGRLEAVVRANCVLCVFTWYAWMEQQELAWFNMMCDK